MDTTELPRPAKGYHLAGTDVRAATLDAAINFGIARDQRELAILRERLTDDERRAVLAQAAADVLASGRFVREQTK